MASGGSFLPHQVKIYSVKSICLSKLVVSFEVQPGRMNQNWDKDRGNLIYGWIKSPVIREAMEIVMLFDSLKMP